MSRSRIVSPQALRSAPIVCVSIWAFTLSSCAERQVPDWERLYRIQPRSILVLPVENESTQVEAPRFFMATIAKPLIDRGYYVFPVEATTEILEGEGFTSGAELEAVSPASFGKHFGADAVLRVTIKSWDTAYAVIASSVTVTIEYHMIDTRSGEVFWEGTQVVEHRSSASGSDPITLLVTAAVDAALTAALTDYVPLARQANALAAAQLLPGPYDPAYESTKARLIGDWRDYRRRKAEQAAKDANGAKAQ